MKLSQKGRLASDEDPAFKLSWFTKFSYKTRVEIINTKKKKQVTTYVKNKDCGAPLDFNLVGIDVYHSLEMAEWMCIA